MSLKLIKWLLPIILELFKGDGRYPGFFSRNKTISLLLIACMTCLALALFMFEQASLHGASSKVNKTAVLDLTNRLDQCNKSTDKLVTECSAK